MHAVGYAYRDHVATDVPHLWIVFASPAYEPDERAIVSVTSDGLHINDRSCRLDVGDHPTIRHLSFALYRKSRIITVTDLDAWLANKYAIPSAPIAPSVTLRIRAGALESPFTPREVQEAVRTCRWKGPTE